MQQRLDVFKPLQVLSMVVFQSLNSLPDLKTNDSQRQQKMLACLVLEKNDMFPFTWMSRWKLGSMASKLVISYLQMGYSLGL